MSDLSRASARLPLHWFSWNLMLKTFTKICWETPDVAKFGHFTWRRMYFDSNMKHCIVRKQCKDNPYLHFHGITEQFSVIHCCIWVKNQNGMYCCVYKPTIVSWTWRSVTLHLHLPVLLILIFGFAFKKSRSGLSPRRRNAWKTLTVATRIAATMNCACKVDIDIITLLTLVLAVNIDSAKGT
jgi:hypothetical protein